MKRMRIRLVCFAILLFCIGCTSEATVKVYNSKSSTAGITVDGDYANISGHDRKNFDIEWSGKGDKTISVSTSVQSKSYTLSDGDDLDITIY